MRSLIPSALVLLAANEATAFAIAGAACGPSIAMRAMRAMPVAMRMPWEPLDLDATPEDASSGKEEKKGIDLEGLMQLVTMGAGEQEFLPMGLLPMGLLPMGLLPMRTQETEISFVHSALVNWQVPRCWEI